MIKLRLLNEGKFMLKSVLPLSFIGILPGLFITGRTFGFMAIIGTISLSGMMIKSGIVLIDQIRICTWNFLNYIIKKTDF